jgi:fluoride ion exporter CrcB/FEX
MHPKQFARFGGTLLVFIGLLALVPSFSTYSQDLPSLNIENSYGLFFNSIPMNIVNKLVVIALGVLGVLSTMSSTRALPMAIRWSQLVFVISAVAFVMGLISSTNTFFGYMPLFGGDAVFHAVLGVLGAYFGFALKAKADRKIAPLTRDGNQFGRKAG